ncbi:hypothetical protein P910_001622 [Xylella fastidiosa Mul-MD]|nr:hypothetical protein P910_001622 [Xylella fastidiosa Mul-MD]
MDACGTVHIVGLRGGTPNTGVTTIWQMLLALLTPIWASCATVNKSNIDKIAQPIDFIGAGNEARTRDLNLGKVALYQLSYSRLGHEILHA